ncbi:MAG: CBS domain-containing protein [Acidobacteriia bacterium]|nr:CBS domain-containing protein [Terriglobia bacterium]
MRVEEVMMRTPACCSPESNLGTATELLWSRNCGILPIVDAQQKVIGVITDRDLCIALGTRNQLAGQVQVGEVMSQNVVSCRPEEDIHAALDTMARNRVRRLPVVNKEGRLEGILSMDNIVLHADAAGTGKTAELAPRDIVVTLQRIYGPRVPQLVETRTATAR